MTNLAFAEPVASPDKFEIYDDWSGGLNTSMAAHKLPKNQTPNAQNGYIDEVDKAIVTRNGMTVAGRNPYLEKINFQFEYVPESGDKGFFQSDSSRVTYTTDFMNYTVIKNTMTTTAKLRAAQGRGYALFTNGTDPVFISSGFIGIPLDGNHGRANVPRGKYAAFNLERFFVFATTASKSQLYWSSVKSTDGFTYPVESPLSWPSNNSRFIGENDGAEGSGLDVYRGQLLAHKNDKSIYTLFGNTDSGFLPRRTNAHSGTIAQETIVQSDNIEYYLDREGVYAFDGSDSVRISDDIQPNIDDIVINSQSTESLIWDTQSDFSNGTFSLSTALVSGTLTPFQNQFYLNTSEQSSGGSGNTVNLTEASTFTAYMAMVTTGSVNSANTWLSGNPANNAYPALYVFGTVANTGKTSPTMRVRIRNIATDAEFVHSYAPTAGGSKQRADFFISAGTMPAFTQSELNTGKYGLKFEYVCPASPCEDYALFVPTIAGNAQIVVRPSSNTSYVSEITTATGLTTWGFFNSVNNTNSGTINYFIKGATSPVNISTEAFVSVIPGNRITLPVAKNVIQWASSMTSIQPGVATSPQTEDVNITYNTGAPLDSNPQAIEWKNRYILMCSTLSDGSSTIMYVKSKITNSNPNAWVKFTFANDYFKSIAKFNDNLYLGSGSTGTVYRFDYGTNDNGSAINWFHETPDTTMGGGENYFFKKDQMEYFVDADKTQGATLTIGTTIDGSSYTAKTVDLSGSGRLLKSVKNVPKIGKYFRYKFANSELDKRITFNTFMIRYQQSAVRD